MPGKYASDEEKSRIFAWRQEHVPIKVICERSGRGKATIMRLLAAAKDLPNNTVPKHKFGGGRKKTSPHSDTIVKREQQKNPRLTALELQNLHPELLQHVKIRTVQHRLQNDLDLPSRKPAKKNSDYRKNEDKWLAFAKKYSHWTTEQWRKVMFSYESNFQVFKMGCTQGYLEHRDRLLCFFCTFCVTTVVLRSAF